LSGQTLITLNGSENTSDLLQLNITNTSFTGVEGWGDYAAVLGTMVAKVGTFFLFFFF
jgi:hypothetical protein